MYNSRSIGRSQVLMTFVLCLLGCRGGWLPRRAHIGSTPTFSTKTMTKANPVDSDGRTAALRLAAKKKTKTAAKSAAGEMADDKPGALAGAGDGLPDGAEIDHGYLNIVGLGFYPSPDMTGDELSLISDVQHLMMLDVKIEQSEQSNPLSTAAYYEDKLQLDLSSENQSLRSGNPNLANLTDVLIDVNAGDTPLTDISLVDGTYMRFEVTLGRSGYGAPDHPVHGYSFAVSGFLPLAGRQVPFLARTKQLITMRTDMSKSPLIVANGSLQGSFNLNFDETGWLNSIDFNHLTVSQTGLCIIDDHTNPEVLAAFTKNIVASILTIDPNGVATDHTSDL